ncbi:hypothetical protein IE81DRAFT_319176 [Ceraceosorus guamensis]|uniref:L domain-like protein n=1 Tax=Ceraceosorus guamensis TaxID=1522189 RepID=A0A316WBG0_9BASI|nr:hypothetical protein IE81DRAFT_319176 [Ceraceosorus guamensis]PWN46288.1 hypothetical protein IE81DRAFT_319176 [Ceraceosorus guamensis]
METQAGDEWLAAYATYIRSNAVALAGQSSSQQARASTTNSATSSSPSTLSWLTLPSASWVGLQSASNAPEARQRTASTASGNHAPSDLQASRPRAKPQPTPKALPLNTHHLYYLLLRFEALGLPVGSLDVRIPRSARPVSSFSYVSAHAQRGGRKPRDTDTMSVGSVRSALTALSGASTLTGWWSGSSEKGDPLKDVKFIYSAFTKVPRLRLGPLPIKLIESFEDSPGSSLVPLDVFKNIQTLELDEIDPSSLLGWDRLSIQLRSLTLRNSGLEDVTDLLVDAVKLDVRRRRGEQVKPAQRRIHSPAPVDQPPVADTRQQPGDSPPSTASLGGLSSVDDAHASGQAALPFLSWHFLRHLALPDNSLTFFSPPADLLSNLTSLDLSSNLLISAPPSLNLLPNLKLLNLEGNLIETVWHISLAIPNIEALNLANNRLESLAGAEDLKELRRIDLRGTELAEASEVGRLAVLQNLEEIYTKGALFMEDADPRVDVFVEFAREGREIARIRLDGEAPGYFEKQRVAERVPTMLARIGRESTPAAEELSVEEAPVRLESQQAEPPVVAVRHRVKDPSTASGLAKVQSADGHRPTSPAPGTTAKRRARRIVELGQEEEVAPLTAAALPTPTPQEISDSDLVKRAALAGKLDVALGEAEKANVIPSPKGKARQLDDVPNDLPAARLQARTNGNDGPRARPQSFLAPGTASISRKTGAAAALLSRESSGDADGAGRPRVLSSASTLGAASASSSRHAVLPSRSQTLQGLAGISTQGLPSRVAGRSVDDAAIPSDASSLDADRVVTTARTRAGGRFDAASLTARRKTVTASLYDPSTTSLGIPEPSGASLEARSDDAPASTGRVSQSQSKSAAQTGKDDFRKRIEAMRDGMGDEWLRALARGSVYLDESSEG